MCPLIFVLNYKFWRSFIVVLCGLICSGLTWGARECGYFVPIVYGELKRINGGADVHLLSLNVGAVNGKYALTYGKGAFGKIVTSNTQWSLIERELPYSSLNFCIIARGHAIQPLSNFSQLSNNAGRYSISNLPVCVSSIDQTLSMERTANDELGQSLIWSFSSSDDKGLTYTFFMNGMGEWILLEMRIKQSADGSPLFKSCYKARGSTVDYFPHYKLNPAILQVNGINN